MKTILSRLMFSIVVLSMGATSFVASGAQTNVSVGDNFFSPSSVTIAQNDSVRWVWVGSFHTSTSDGGLWDSGFLGPGSTFTNVFTSSGTFPYHCSLHFGMDGSVVVAAANQPPSISITNPPNNSIFAAPWTGTISAAASDADGSVTNVQFFRNGISQTNIASPPFNLSVSNLAAGNYSFTAVARDNLGATNSSAPVAVSVVTPVATLLTNIVRLSTTQARFDYSANVGLVYAVERSGVLTNFTAIATNTAAASSVTFTDNAATADINFYRVRRLPNP